MKIILSVVQLRTIQRNSYCNAGADFAEHCLQQHTYYICGAIFKENSRELIIDTAKVLLVA